MSALTDPEITLLSDRLGDAQTVARWIWEEWHTGTLDDVVEQLIDPPECPPTLLAVVGATPVGVISFRRYQRAEDSVPLLWINSLYVLAAYRRQSIGTTLLAEATSRAKEFEIEIFAYTSAISFYQHRGWSIVEPGQSEGLAVLRRRT